MFPPGRAWRTSMQAKHSKRFNGTWMTWGDTQTRRKSRAPDLAGDLKRRRRAPTILDNAGVGDCQANGAVETADIRGTRAYFPTGVLLSIGRQVHRISPRHAELVGLAVHVLSKYGVGKGGRTGYERMKGSCTPMSFLSLGNNCSSNLIRPCRTEDKIEGERGLCSFWVICWRTGVDRMVCKGGAQQQHPPSAMWDMTEGRGCQRACEGPRVPVEWGP